MPLLSQGSGGSFDFGAKWWLWLLVGVGLLVMLVFLVVFLSFIRLWIQSFLTGAKIGLVDLIRMKLATWTMARSCAGRSR
jgi:hypothetical protein